MILELMQLHPRISILVVAALVSLFISIINYFVLDKDKLRSSRARQKEISKEMKESKGNPTKMMELQKELTTHTLEQMKHSFKPMLITMIPALIIFWWIRGVFEETTIAATWFWWYLGGAIGFSIIFRKLFKLP